MTDLKPCPCKGVDDYCPCQNVLPVDTRAPEQASAGIEPVAWREPFCNNKEEVIFWKLRDYPGVGFEPLYSQATVDALIKERDRLVELNAVLMGDDEDLPRYTTRRLRKEIADAVSKARSDAIEECEEVVSNFLMTKTALSVEKVCDVEAAIRALEVKP